jgi:hypothetical protein
MPEYLRKVLPAPRVLLYDPVFERHYTSFQDQLDNKITHNEWLDDIRREASRSKELSTRSTLICQSGS